MYMYKLFRFVGAASAGDSFCLAPLGETIHHRVEPPNAAISVRIFLRCS